jgi:hypothetical protein
MMGYPERVVNIFCSDYNCGMKKKKPGRPKTENPADERVFIRVRPDQFAAWTAAAGRAGRSLSAWLKQIADRAAKH